VNNLTSIIKKDRGFTIVELLVVIVVIGILASITIVSYSGITQSANNTKAQTNANAVAKVANVYAADSASATPGSFPSLANLNSYTNITKVPSGVTVIAGGDGVLTTSNYTTNVIYQVDDTTPTTGACVGYLDNTGTMSYIYLGVSTAGDLNIASPTCD
jgi:prepilin-type N-terminal cleavage/methylation domain-containing protein